MSCLLCYVISSSLYLLIITLPSVPISVFMVSFSGHCSWCLISCFPFVSILSSTSNPAFSTPWLFWRSSAEFDPGASLGLRGPVWASSDQVPFSSCSFWEAAGLWKHYLLHDSCPKANTRTPQLPRNTSTGSHLYEHTHTHTLKTTYTQLLVPDVAKAMVGKHAGHRCYLEEGKSWSYGIMSCSCKLIWLNQDRMAAKKKKFRQVSF